LDEGPGDLSTPNLQNNIGKEKVVLTICWRLSFKKLPINMVVCN
jgi:hypothetical protein